MIKGRMVYIGGPSAMKRGIGKIVKEALQDAGGLWHRRYLPMHFQPGAGNKYKYQPRTRAYLRHKQKRKGHRRPLEFSGDLKRELTRKAALSGSSKRVRVVMDTGPAWYATRKWVTRTSMPDMPSEITQTTNAEVKKLARIAEVVTARRLNEIKTRETKP
jgi:hypothetical protein